MSKKSKSTKKKEEEKILYLALTFFLGPAVIGVSLWALNFVGVGVGVFLEAWGIWGLPEIHPYLKVIINWKNRNKTQTQQVEVKQSPDANVLTAGRDVNVFNIPRGKEPVVEPAEEPVEEPEKVYIDAPDHPIIDDTPVLPPKKEISYNLNLKKDETVAIEVNADYPATTELISMLEWETKVQGGKYSAEKYRDKAKNANIEFTARRGGDYVIWVYNDSRNKQQIGVRVWKES